MEEESRNVQQEVSGLDRGSAMTCALPSLTKKTKDLNLDDSIGYFISRMQFGNGKKNIERE